MPSRIATERGIHAMMSLAEAQALLESAMFLPHDSEADSQQLEALAYFCHRYSPTVGVEKSHDSHCLLLDVSGCSHLFGDEFGLVRQLITELAEQGYFGHVAAAKTIGAAWAIARYGHKTASDRRLRSLPIEALRIPDKLVSCLHEFDLRMIGQLKALPRDALRFPPDVRLHHSFPHRPRSRDCRMSARNPRTPYSPVSPLTPTPPLALTRRRGVGLMNPNQTAGKDRGRT